MTREELVEKVARAICKAVGDNPDANGALPGFEKFPLWRDWTDAARAAIAIVLEEAAKQAEDCIADEYEVSKRVIGNAIRALKPGDENEI